MTDQPAESPHAVQYTLPAALIPQRGSVEDNAHGVLSSASLHEIKMATVYR